MAKVLVVDDEESVREPLKIFLLEDGYEVFTAPDVSKAIEILEKNKIDVVVTDIILPQMSGMELLSKIRETSHKVQVILMTGEPTVETASRAVRESAFDYLAKPVSGKIIRKAVASAIRLKALHAEKDRLEKENLRYQKHLEKLVQERTKELGSTNAQLQRSLEQLKKSFNGIINAMAITIEKRDPYTAGHQLRVAHLARAIAEKMNIIKDYVTATWMAGIIHDIGKLSIPAEILAKPTKLCVEEFSIIKKHPQTGYDILKTIDFPFPIADIVLQHHERIDGSGYPQGLMGDKLLLPSKILAVADVVEAMAHHRPYRPALGLPAALEEISNNKAILYDSDVVEACLDIFHEKSFSFADTKSLSDQILNFI